MPYIDLYKELHGVVPKIPQALCKTFINRAWRDIRRKNIWSFQLFESCWFTPSLITGGTVTVTQGQNTVVFDAAAAALINAIGLVPSPVTARQFRIDVNTIYNIWGWDGTNTATLDRPYCEASATGSAYSIMQCYYPAPFQDFRAFLTVRDTINNWELVTTRNRGWIDEQDRQRQNYRQPTHVVPFMPDNNPASPTFGWMLFELWGQPQYQLPYIIYGIRRGADLSDDTDTLPSVIGEDCVVELAKVKAYEWAEANKGDNPRNAGPDFRFLMGIAKAEYTRLWHEYRKDDRELVDNWVAVRQWKGAVGAFSAYYNAIAGVASPGVE